MASSHAYRPAFTLKIVSYAIFWSIVRGAGENRPCAMLGVFRGIGLSRHSGSLVVNHFRCAFRASSARFSCSSFCPASPSLPSAVKRW